MTASYILYFTSIKIVEHVTKISFYLRYSTTKKKNEQKIVKNKNQTVYLYVN